MRKIHFKYGYYLDKCLYNEVVDMFADHPDTYVEFLGSRYRGKEGVKRLYQGRFQNTFVKGRNGPVHGFLLDHIMMQDIVDVDSTGTHAWVRMRALMSAGTHDSVNETHPRGHVQWWEGGLYENEYLKVSTRLLLPVCSVVFSNVLGPWTHQVRVRSRWLTHTRRTVCGNCSGTGTFRSGTPNSRAAGATQR